MKIPPVSILTSGIGLGVYLPALLIEQQLARLEVPSQIEVLEGYYTPEALARQLAYQRACRDNFALAQMGHRMARGVEDCLDDARIGELLGRWAAEERRHFIVWSGFWLPLLERHRRAMKARLQIDCCRIDAEVSASFRVHDGLLPDATEIWLWSWAERRTVFEIPVDDRPPPRFSDRERRLVVHGGGWGLGNYRERLEELRGWSCDVVVHEAVEATAGHRHFRVDPEWRAWHGGFPPLRQIGGGTAGDGHALFEMIRNSRAIVSKPGGGTLIDSLASATPVVLLEPYGHAEAKNGELWRHLGFGVSFEEWSQSGFSEELLAGLHENLLRRTRNGPDYPRAYAERIRR